MNIGISPSIQGEQMDSTDHEIRVLLQEYDIIYREHDSNLKMRQEILSGTLIATAALVGVIIGIDTIFSENLAALRFFLILPFAFTFLTWWFIRTNQSNLIIELYVGTVLKPRLSFLVRNPVARWTTFLYLCETSLPGSILLVFQTISRLALIQGPGIISLVLFFVSAQETNLTISRLDWLLTVANVICFVISIILVILTFGLTRRVRGIAREDSEMVKLVSDTLGTGTL